MNGPGHRQSFAQLGSEMRAPIVWFGSRAGFPIVWFAAFGSRGLEAKRLRPSRSRERATCGRKNNVRVVALPSLSVLSGGHAAK